MGIFELCLIGAMLAMGWILVKVMIAIIDLLAKLIGMAIAVAIALMLLAALAMHARPG